MLFSPQSNNAKIVSFNNIYTIDVFNDFLFFVLLFFASFAILLFAFIIVSIWCDLDQFSTAHLNQISSLRTQPSDLMVFT